MAFTLWNLFETSLLCLNAFTIINEERLVDKFDSKHSKTNLLMEENEAKMQVFNLIHSISTIAKFPVIFLNIITIILKLLLGS
ncbi:immediate early response 3-interacting protein 1 [Leptinotarsa decemlineata]|uniref:immediate early response 3-interacting protein 1 n=1 Tax=Leptinotarsa decemlineata TaxID=7539 RepID=UPI000C25431E|nr:immediate early response 3-interacting protein 1-like [Leptinotarsa decemlineata]